MKKCLIITCGMIFISSILASEPIVISTGEFAPYTTKSLPNHGFVNHLITEVFKQENYQVEYVYLPWKRSYLSMVQGKYIASSYWFVSAERKKDSYISAYPLYTDTYYFFHLKSNPLPDWSTLEDLKGKRIGTIRGSTYTPKFWNLGKEHVYYLDVVNRDIQNFQKLLSGRIDAFPINKLVAHDLIRKNLNAQERELITYHPKYFTKTDAFLLFSKAHKDSQKMLEVFNRGMKKMIDNGSYDKLHNDLLNGKYSP